MLFECRNVTKNFGALVAVHDVSFSLDDGQTVGIMGPNGAGKSTLLDLIMGVYPLTNGEIYFAGEQINGLPTNRISSRGIGRTYQIPQPFTHMTVLENVLVGEMYGYANRSMREARSNALAILENVGLASKAETISGQLGLLDLKRLELARALSLRPRLLLLDEIASGLVESEVEKLQQLIATLRQTGQAMIIIEHVLSVMFNHSDRIIVLDFGERIAEGRPEEIAKDEKVIEIYLGQENGSRQPTPANGTSPQQIAERQPLLSVSNLSAGYGDFQALFDVSLDIYEGEIVALIGLNGAGKTTLIRAITSQLPLLNGDVALRGQSIANANTHDIAEFGIAQCIEGRKIFPLMTVRENLEIGAYPPRARARRQETIERVYALFPWLAERADQLGGTLSGGEQQMLAIGRALMALPELIIFDEVSLGLAPLIIDDLYKTIIEINQAGTTILLVEQNVHRSLHIAHRAYIIERGRIVLTGTTEELSQNQEIKDTYFGLEENR